MKGLLLTNIMIVLAFAGITTWIHLANDKLIAAGQAATASDAHVTAAQAKIAVTKQQLASLKDKQDALALRLPSSQNIDTFFSAVNQLAAKYHATTTFSFPNGSANSGNAPTTNGSGQLPFNLTVTADNTDDLLTFLTDLEHSRYIISITSFSMSPSASPPQATLGFNLYVQASS